MYNIDEIKIGDEVAFHSTKYQSSYDECWTVTGKMGTKVFIELRKFGIDAAWTLDIKDVAIHIPTSQASI